MIYLFWALVGAIAGYLIGWGHAHLTVAEECEKLGRFYVNDKIYICRKIKKEEKPHVSQEN